MLRAAAPHQVAGLTEIGLRAGEVACLRLVEAELAELLDAPTEDLDLLVENRRSKEAAAVSAIPH